MTEFKNVKGGNMKINFSACTLMLTSALSSMFTAVAHANTNVVCEIENPCAWLEPVPGTESSLGFCVTKLTGDRKDLVAEITNKDGALQRTVVLRISTFNEEHIRATDEHGGFELAVGRYADFYAGGLLVKTQQAPDGLGFMTACRATENLK